jgi:hypothetical protein
MINHKLKIQFYNSHEVWDEQQRGMCSILWHVDLLLGNYREISSYTTAIARKQLQHIPSTQQWNYWETIFSTRSVQ